MWWVDGGGGLLDYIVSYLGQVIVIVIGRPRSMTISVFVLILTLLNFTKDDIFSRNS